MQNVYRTQTDRQNIELRFEQPQQNTIRNFIFWRDNKKQKWPKINTTVETAI